MKVAGVGWGLASIIILSIVLFTLRTTAENRYIYPFSPVSTMHYVDDNPYLELGAMFFGLRSMAADIAWIKTLQYYGGPTEGETREEHEQHIAEEASGKHHHEHQLHDSDPTAYRKLYALCTRAVWLDPYFFHVYYIGSGAIGFVQERYEEAAALLKEGVVWNYNPNSVHYWRLNYALAALGYEKVKDYKKAIAILEKMIDPADSPLILLRVLANTYEKNGDYRKSIKMWNFIGRKFPDQEMKANQKMETLSKKVSE